MEEVLAAALGGDRSKSKRGREVTRSVGRKKENKGSPQQ